MSLISKCSSDLQTVGLSSRNKSRRLCHRQPHGVLCCLRYSGASEHTKCHFPPICTQIYLMCQLHRKCGDRIIRIGIRRGITIQSDVKAIRIHTHSCSDILHTGCRNPQVKILSISFPADEIFENALPIPFIYFIYFINATFSDANWREFLPIKLSFD